MSTATRQLERDILDLEREHDALVRAIERKHQEYDHLLVNIQARTEQLDKIKAEIQKVKKHFGV
jgi:septation ring formation regulator EzrA